MRRIRRAKHVDYIQIAPESWREALTSFDESNQTGVGVKRKIRPSTRALYLRLIEGFATTINKPIPNLTTQDLTGYIKGIDNKFTQRHTCATLKKFFKFANREDLASQISVPTISISERKDQIDRITEAETKKLLAAEDNARNQALIALLYESAGRLSEVLNLKIKDVQVDKFGCIVKLFGKTELRNIRLIASAPYVMRWLNLHTGKDDPAAWLFYTHGATKHEPVKRLGKTMTAKILHNAARKAGFKNLDKFHPHAFRHGRLSELGHSLTDSELKFVGGWNDEARRMISLYSHCDEDRVNNKLLNLQGIATEEESSQASELKVMSCPRCKNLNDSTSKFCNTCGLPLTPEGIKQLDTAKDNEIAELKEKLAKIEVSREGLTALLKRVEELEQKLQKS